MATVTSKKLGRWTQERFEKAKRDGDYMKAGGSATSTLALTGAEKRWKEDPSFIYVPQFRVAGTPDQIRAFMASTQVKKEDLERAMSQGYSFANTREGQSMFQAYQEEIQSRKESRIKPEEKYFTLEQIVKLGVDMASGGSTGSTKSTGASRGGHKLDLLSRIEQAKKTGEVLDVSTMKDNGTNVRKIKKPTGRTVKVGPEGLGIVSSDRGKFEQVLRLLGRSDDEVRNLLAQWDTLASQQKPAPPAISAVLAPPAPPAPPAVAVKPVPLVPPLRSPTRTAGPSLPPLGLPSLPR